MEAWRFFDLFMALREDRRKLRKCENCETLSERFTVFAARPRMRDTQMTTLPRSPRICLCTGLRWIQSGCRKPRSFRFGSGFFREQRRKKWFCQESFDSHFWSTSNGAYFSTDGADDTVLIRMIDDQVAWIFENSSGFSFYSRFSRPEDSLQVDQ